MFPGEEDIQQLADEAEAEIGRMLDASAASHHALEARAALWESIRKWMRHPDFLRGTNMLRCTVLNQLVFRQSDPELVGEARAMLRELAATYPPDVNPEMAESLIIDAFECHAENPDDKAGMEFLFSLAEDLATRWATFEAYRLFPWWLAPNAAKYSRGHVTEADCAAWFEERFPHCKGMPVVSIDWSRIASEDDFYDIVSPQCGFPSWHGRNLDALEDSWVTGGIDTNGPPYVFEFRNPGEATPEMRRLLGYVDEIAKDSWRDFCDPFR